MPDPRIASVKVRRVVRQVTEDRDDVVVVEEPLEIRAAWTVSGELREKSISVTMRTPGDDADLAAGFLFTEGLVQSAADIESVRHWSSPNVIRVALRDGVRIDTARLERHFYTTSSCGVCGKTSIEALRVATSARPRQTKPVTTEVIHQLPRRLEEHQAAFRLTGGLHAAAILDFQGALIVSREDIGRHNAVDKVIGSLFVERRMPLLDTILLVSSRASFEIVQKAVMAGIPVVASVGAPSTLAIQLATEFGVTLLGFVRNERFNVYAGEVGAGNEPPAAEPDGGSDRERPGAGESPPERTNDAGMRSSLERVAVRTRESGITHSAWRTSVDSSAGSGSITLLDGGFYRGDGIFLERTQEELAAEYARLNPPSDEPSMEYPQLG